MNWGKLRNLALSLLPLTAVLIPGSAIAADNDYDTCAGNLLGLNIPPETVAERCSKMLHPEDFSSCVVDISRQTDIIPSDALDTCSQVRRPLELATCTVQISDVAPATEGPNILENCRRSLLPVRFSDCVLGLNNQTDLAIADSLVACIDAQDPVRNLDPTFIPREELPERLRPPSGVPST